MTVFIVDSKMPGFSVGVKEDKMGVRASNTSELVFEEVRVPQENILGNLGEGFKMAMKILDFGRIGIAAQHSHGYDLSGYAFDFFFFETGINRRIVFEPLSIV